VSEELGTCERLNRDHPSTHLRRSDCFNWCPLPTDRAELHQFHALVAESVDATNDMTMELREFGPAVFETVASMWGLSIDVTGITTEPCCDDPGCVDEVGLATITMKRPGAESFAYVTTMGVEDLSTVPLTPAWVLSDISHLMIEMSHTATLEESFRQFCWAPEGDEPQLEMEHLRAFAMAADALEFFVLPEDRNGGA